MKMMQTQDILISVVIPLYNGVDHIVKCIDSLDNQDCSFLFEVIVIDDCSGDDSVALVENHLHELKHKDAFYLIKSSKNGRAGAARNIGVKLSKGHYILFIDQDDYPDQKMLRVLWENSQGGNVDLVSCAVMDRNGSPYYRQGISADHILTDEERKNAILDYGYVFASLIKRRILTENNLFFPENVMFEDCLYNVGLVCCVETIQTIRDILYYRENDPNSQTGSPFSAKKLNDRIDAVKIYLSDYYNNEKMKMFLPQIKMVAFYYIYLSCAYWMLMSPKLYQKKLFVRCLSEGRQLNMSWVEVRRYERAFSKPVLYMLELIYYVPFMAFWARLCRPIAHKAYKVVKGKKG